MPCKAGSIRQIRERLIQEGYQISEYTLRKWANSGLIPSRKSGNKTILVYDRVVEFLNSENNVA